jgi:hypothetical protein
MQARISFVDDKFMQAKLNIILSKLASGVHPTTDEILEIRILFQGEPYHLNCLYPRHKVGGLNRDKHLSVYTYSLAHL